MKVTWGLEHATYHPKTITTLGSYDGVHLGHQKILQTLAQRKRELGLERSVVLTFHPHPQQVLRKSTGVSLLTTIEERLELLAEQNVDETIVIQFSLEFAQTSYIDFFRHTIVEGLGTKAMVVGYNHAFGKNREGDALHLKKLAPELGVTVEEVSPFVLEGVSISSTTIRLALAEARLKDANTWLGHPYSLRGTVIHGDALGATLGYPTANLEIDEAKVTPADGVYAAHAYIDDVRHLAALSIGTRPTVTDRPERAIEALLLDFSGDLYGHTMRIDCLDYLRPQQKFDSLDELKLWIGKDVETVRVLLQ